MYMYKKILKLREIHSIKIRNIIRFIWSFGSRKFIRKRFIRTIILPFDPYNYNNLQDSPNPYATVLFPLLFPYGSAIPWIVSSRLSLKRGVQRTNRESSCETRTPEPFSTGSTVIYGVGKLELIAEITTHTFMCVCVQYINGFVCRRGDHTEKPSIKSNATTFFFLAALRFPRRSESRPGRCRTAYAFPRTRSTKTTSSSSSSSKLRGLNWGRRSSSNRFAG